MRRLGAFVSILGLSLASASFAEDTDTSFDMITPDGENTTLESEARKKYLIVDFSRSG